MDNINIDSSIGNCGVVMSLQLKNADKANKLAALHLLHHASASKAFNKKAKDAGIDRESGYSDDLAKHVIAAIREVFAPVFDIVSIESKAVEKLNDEQKFVKFAKSLGMDDAAIAAGWAAAQAEVQRKAESAKPAEEPAKPTESVN